MIVARRHFVTALEMLGYASSAADDVIPAVAAAKGYSG
jgi:Holliday junction resolvasome RuvABC DNA-binding subunit